MATTGNELNRQGRYEGPLYFNRSLDGSAVIDDLGTRTAVEAVRTGAVEATVFRPGKEPTIVTSSRQFEFNNVQSADTDRRLSPNPLLDYTSYTYNISLHMLSTATYNRLMAQTADIFKEQFNYRPENVLIASAGTFRGSNTNVVGDYEGSYTFRTPQRHPFWQEDFYFDEVKFTTVIGPGKVNRGTNAIEGTIRVIEPNGFTLINRLVETAQVVNPNQNYIFMPYMLQIDFYAINGNIETNSTTAEPKKLDQLTKFFPILLTGIKTKVSSRGAEYLIDFVPYAHRSLSKVRNVCPADFQVRASTVQEFFDNTVNDNLRVAIRQYQERIKRLRDIRSQRTDINLNGESRPGQFDTANQVDQEIGTLKDAVKNTKLPVSGFCEAYNAWHQSLVDDNQDNQADQLEIRFHKDIANSKIFSLGAAPVDIQQVATNPNISEKTKLEAQAGKPVGTISWNAGIVSVGAGTVIDKLIEYVVRNSDYFINQLSVSKELKRDAPLNWYRIIPRAEIIGYSKFRKTYVYKVIWYVVPFKIYGSNSPYAPNGLPGPVTDPLRGALKEYNYIFTGKNNDVLDLSIDFDMMYYVALPVFRNQTSTQQTGYPATPIDNTDKLNNFAGSPAAQVNLEFISGTQLLGTTTGEGDSNKVIATGVANEINKTTRGDMINVKMKILGDPDFVKQDDVFYNAFFWDQIGSRIPVGRSLWMDNGELTVNLNINSPIDYNDNLGIAAPDRFTYNSFSGIYKITTIENVFSRGKFEQVLDIIRVPLQPDKLLEIDQNSNRQRAPSVQYQNQITVTPPRSFRGVPIRSSQNSISQAINQAYAGQQAAQNSVGQALAATGSVAGGLAAGASLVQQFSGLVVGNLVQRGVNFAVDQAGGLVGDVASKIKDIFSSPVPDFEGAGFAASLAEANPIIPDFEGAGFAADIGDFGGML